MKNRYLKFPIGIWPNVSNLILSFTPNVTSSCGIRARFIRMKKFVCVLFFIRFLTSFLLQPQYNAMAPRLWYTTFLFCFQFYFRKNVFCYMYVYTWLYVRMYVFFVVAFVFCFYKKKCILIPFGCKYFSFFLLILLLFVCLRSFLYFCVSMTVFSTFFFFTVKFSMVFGLWQHSKKIVTSSFITTIPFRPPLQRAISFTCKYTVQIQLHKLNSHIHTHTHTHSILLFTYHSERVVAVKTVKPIKLVEEKEMAQNYFPGGILVGYCYFN